MKLLKNKKTIGLTLFESLIAVVISITTLVFILTFTGRNISESQRKNEISEELTVLMKAIINRIDVDGGIKNTPNKSYKTKAELGSFIKMLNGRNSEQNCGTWNPDSLKPSLNQEMIKSHNINCSYFNSSKLKSNATVTVNSANDSITILFDYNDGAMKENLRSWATISDELIISPRAIGYGSQSYGFINKVSGDPLNNRECALDYSNCAFKMSYSIPNEPENKYLSTVGANMQVGKVKFANGLLNPQICQKWTINNGVIKGQEDVFCGVENNDGKIGFKLNDIITDNITVGDECRMIETDIDYNFVGYQSGSFPCGFVKIKEDTDVTTQLIVSSITDSTSVESSRTKKSTTDRNDSRISQNEELNVGGSMVANNANVKELKVDSNLRGIQIRSSEFNTNHIYLYSLDVDKPENEFRNLKAVSADIKGVSRTNIMNTMSLNANTVKTKGIVFDGDLKIEGDLNTNKYNGIGILKADDIIDSGNDNFNLRSSSFLGGYIEIDGKNNPSKKGISGVDGVDLTANYVQALDRNGFAGNRLSMNSGGAENVSINQSSQAQFIKKGVQIKSNSGFGNYITIDGDSASIKIETNETNGPDGFIKLSDSSNLRGQNLSGGTPTQVLGNVIATDNTFYSIIVNERFDDIFDTTPISKINLDKLESRSHLDKYPNYAVNSLLNAVHRNDVIHIAFQRVADDIIEAENVVRGGGPLGGTGAQGIRGSDGLTGPRGPMGPLGPVGPIGPVYDSNQYIWLSTTPNKPSNCLSVAEASRLGQNNWDYFDVIEGVCSIAGQVKYFQNRNSYTCPSGTYPTEAYKCEKAAKRLEPYSYNKMPVYSVCDVASSHPDFGLMTNLKREYINKSRQARLDQLYEDCSVSSGGEKYYTYIDLDQQPSSSIRIDVPDFNRYFNGSPIKGNVSEVCETNKLFQVSMCKSAGVNTYKYKEYPDGFLRSIGR